MRQIGPSTTPARRAPNPPWHVVVRDLRRTAGVSQEGWAARLEFGRRTVQRWEAGIQAPSAQATAAIIELCRSLALFRRYTGGPLAGLTIDASMLAELLTAARLEDAPVPAREAARNPPDLRRGLPHPLTGIIGREWEVTELARLISASRLVTITGIGGVGKTRLAIEVASRLEAELLDGAAFVPLNDVRDATLLPTAVGHALGVRQWPGIGAAQTVIRSLQDQAMVLVLDNCEHVRDAAAEFVADVVASCESVHVVATSRERLGLPGEVTWPLAPLIVPADPSTSTTAEIGGSDAVRLFVERARSARPGFRMTDANARAIARIVRRLDGLPLAIELAAARASVLTPHELETHLRDRLDLVSASAAGGAPRHRTLTAALDWSWDLLTDDERGLLAELAVFPDGWTLSGFESVCVGRSLEALARLVDLSFVDARPDDRTGGMRYRLLETVRVYAASRREQMTTDDLPERRLKTWCVEAARGAGYAVHGPDQGAALAWVEAEHGTIRDVMQRALDAADARTATALIAALWWAWGAIGRGGEASTWTARTLMLLDPSIPTTRIDDLGRTLLAAAAFASFGGEIELAQARLNEAEDVATATGDGQLSTLINAQRTRILQMNGRFDDAAVLATAVYGVGAESADAWTSSRMLEVRAHAATRAGRLGEARRWLTEAEGLERTAGDAWGIATVLSELGDLDRAEGRLTDAARRYEECLVLREQLGIAGSTPSLIQNLAFVALGTQDLSSAATKFAAAADEFRRAGDRRGIAECIVGSAGVAVASDAAVEAGRLLGWASETLDRCGAEIWPSNRRDHERIERAVRHALGEVRFTTARDEGATLSLEDVLKTAKNRASLALSTGG